jgi:hypothetical protein
MTDKKLTLGQAIDQIVEALESLDDNSRLAALSAVGAHLKIDLSSSSVGKEKPRQIKDSDLSPTDPPGRSAPLKNVDIRTLKEQKQPKSARQMACLVAYYLQELAPEDEQKDAVSVQDVEKYFKQAGFKLPRKLRQVLADAKQSGYFESGERGEYKLNAVGYNLAAHALPGAKGA